MKRITHRKWFTASVALTALSVCGQWSKDAWACPGPTCEAGDVFPTSGTVPANHFELTWRRLYGHLTAADSVHVYRVSEANPDGGFVVPEGAMDGGTLPRELELQFDPEVVMSDSDGGLVSNAIDPGPVHVTSSEALQEGDLLRVAYGAGACEEGGEPLLSRHGVITLGPPAALPTDLGTLDVETGEGYVDVRMGLCEDRTWVAYAELDVQFSDGARPFADMFMYELSIDGLPVSDYYTGQVLKEEDADWPSRLGGRTAYGKKVLLTADCNGGFVDAEGKWLDMPVPKGTHTVTVIGTLPDGTRVASEPVDVTLDCAVPVCGTQGSPEVDFPCEGRDAGPLPDTAIIDEGPGWEAGIVPEDASVDASPNDSTSAAPTSQSAPSSESAPGDTSTRDTSTQDYSLGADVDGGSSAAQSSSDTSNGCSCTVGAGASERGHYAWAGLLVGLSFLRRRGRSLRAH